MLEKPWLLLLNYFPLFLIYSISVYKALTQSNDYAKGMLFLTIKYQALWKVGKGDILG